MLAVKEGIEFIFGIALFVNALLFIPQSMRILKEKTARGVSLLTFLGLLLIQFTIVLHGIIVHDPLLVWGYLISMVTTGSVVTLILIYRKRKTLSAIDEIDLEEVLAQLPGHIYWKNKDCIFVGSNTNNWKDFGLESLKSFRGKTDYDIFSKQDADQLRIIDEEVIRTGKSKIAEEIVTEPNGKKASYLSHKVPLKNKKGEIIGILGVSVDITASRQNTIDQLDMLENIIAVMPGTVYWMNKDGVYLGCNDNEARAIGLSSRKDIVGKRNVDLSGFLIPEVLDPVNKKVMDTGKPITLEEPATLPDGTKGTFISSKVPIKNDKDEVIGMVGISINITDRKKQEQELRMAKEEAEKSNKIKSDFISNMEHDIRTPFVGIYGMIDILAHQETDPEKKSILRDVSICAKELMDYCDGILDFSRIESESFPIVSKSFILRKVVGSAIAIETIAAKRKKLELSFQYDKQLPAVVIGDPYRLKRILINLVSNAIKFTKEGFTKLSVSLDKHNQDTRRIVAKFTIEDSGMGIPDDKKALIYERFTKVVPSNKGLYKGLGLGLRIVKQFVDELDGDIHLKSEMNKGSTFVVFLPFKIPLSNEIIDEE